MPTRPWPSEGTSPTARKVADLLSVLGATHVVTIPDNTSAPLLQAIRDQEDLELVLATR